MPTKAPATFAARLRSLREQAGLSQSALARAAGITSQHISRMERGQQAPSLEIASRLATALGESLAVFDAARE